MPGSSGPGSEWVNLGNPEGGDTVVRFQECVAMRAYETCQDTDALRESEVVAATIATALRQGTLCLNAQPAT